MFWRLRVVGRQAVGGRVGGIGHRWGTMRRGYRAYVSNLTLPGFNAKRFTRQHTGEVLPAWLQRRRARHPCVVLAD